MTLSNASTGLVALLEAMRPRHWVKNVFVMAPLIFARRFDSPQAWALAALAFAVFCLLSSAVYLVNDMCDRRGDQAHPDKRNRPIASGRLSTPLAAMAATALVAAAGALAAVVCVNPMGESLATARLFVLWAGVYLLEGLFYSLAFKRVAILDVIIIAFGFVLRAMAGAAAIGVPTSPWLVLCTFTLCLYVALSKRRGEIEQLGEDISARARSTNRSYDRTELDRMLTVSVGLAIMSYCLYCLSPRTVEAFGSANMIWTAPLVIYGMFRYDRVSRRRGRGDVVSVLMCDRTMWLVLLAYVLLAGAIIRYGAQPPLQNLLDVYAPKS
ncbi:MAG: decaprenyl-phosphate phosphoribosyltransferase [Planctomycetes bacterium]|jgi:4-hydroxybenzoate polyprenyltransferase|nr:UbiA prenyltransferase family protein [Phycisphaerae bacterium]NBB95184.1 decaprenyl-phosphate phosphoribosyltransferase [Planctomycetota bacterium]